MGNSRVESESESESSAGIERRRIEARAGAPRREAEGEACAVQSGIRNDLFRVTALPLKAATRTLRKTVWMQLPVGVPPNGAETLTEDTGPSGENVTATLPEPVGPPGRLQLATEVAALLSAVKADARLSGAR